MSGATARTNRAIGSEQQDEAVVAEREGEHDGGRDESAICVAGAGAFEALPVYEQDEQQGGQDQVESMGVRVRADRPGDRAVARRIPLASAIQARPVSRARTAVSWRRPPGIALSKFIRNAGSPNVTGRPS
jgi:hypothetical protein